MTIWYFLSIILLILGFGFVIFWHELGHFIAAKAVGIKVEQFAVGFGQALISYRKGFGLQFGSSGKRYDELVRAETEGINPANVHGVSETEYRLNWVPLGGYVKMMGQDDLKPNATVDDPRAFNKKSVGARMIVVSAGVIMNIILAAVGFMILFRMGFNAPPAVVGSVLPGSPAALAVKANDGMAAPLRVGDRLLYLDDNYQHDFTKVPLTIALAQPGLPIPAYVERVDGTRETLSIVPTKMGKEESSFLGIGVAPPSELRGLKQDAYDSLAKQINEAGAYPADYLALKPGESVTHVNGVSLADSANDKAPYKHYAKFHQVLQEAAGKPVTLTVVNEGGQTREFQIQPVLPEESFGGSPVNIAGMVTRPMVWMVNPDSVAKGKLSPGDAFVSVALSDGKLVENPTTTELIDALNKSGQADQPVVVTVLRDGKEITLEKIVPNVSLGGGRKGLGVALRAETATPVVAGTIEASPAAAAGLAKGSLVESVNGTPVANWLETARLIASAPRAEPIALAIRTPEGEEKSIALKLDDRDHAYVASIQAGHQMLLHDRVEPRKTDSLVTAAAWGVTETRDFVLQFYLTLNRMVTGDVSYKNMMGPVGIVHAGAKFAFKGGDWLIWFLSMISANLAVVNFLPIPIVDGGLFLFLIIEKIQGRPLSAKTQSIAQVVGLAVILSIFLLVTYQDIARMM